jgi:hypothetical protein
MKKKEKQNYRQGVKTPNLPWSRRQRFQYLEALAYWRGCFRRSDLLERFNIGIQRISDDIRDYLRLNPDAFVYDRNEKLYRAAPDMKPIFAGIELDEALHLLGERPPELGPWFDCVKFPTRHMNPKVLQMVFRAVAGNRSIRIKYASLNSATFRWRWITPHAFANDGYRWHVRAFCHEERSYKDFVIGRIFTTGELGQPAATAQEDHEWVKIIRIHLVAQVGISDSELRALQLDFGMKEREFEVPVRSALGIYILAQLGLDAKGGSVPQRFRLAEQMSP